MRNKKLIIITLAFAFFITNTNAQDLNWALGFGNHGGTNPGTTFRQDTQGNSYFLERAYELTDLDPGPDVFQVNPGNDGIIVAKFNSAGEFVDGFALSGTADYFSSLDIDSEGNVYITGNFTSCDFDPGLNEYQLQSNGGADLFLAKYNADFGLEWVKTFGNEIEGVTIYGQDLKMDQDQNILLAGHFTDNFDADPGVNELILTTAYSDGYFLKLNPDGELLFARQLLSYSSFSQIFNIDRDSENNILIVGQHTGDVNMDPEGSDFILEPTGDSNMNRLYAKYSPDGTLIWTHSLDEVYESWGYSKMAIDANDDLYSIGYYSGSVDFDAGPGEEIHTTNDINYFILKTSGDGQFLWVQTFDTYYVSIFCVDTDQNGNPVVSGYGSGDIDPGPGVEYLIGENANQDDIFIAQFDADDGHYLSSFTLTSNGSSSDWPYDLIINDQNHAIVNGIFQNDIDMDPGINEYILEYDQNTSSIFIASFSLDECIALDLQIIDVNDIDCENQIGLVEIEIDGVGPFEIEWSNEVTNQNVINPSTPGIYSVTVTDAGLCQKTRHAFVDGPSSMDGVDMEIALFSYSNFTLGNETILQLPAINNGCLEDGGTVTLNFPEILGLVNTNPPADVVNANSVTWNLNPIAYNDPAFEPTISFSVPADENLLGVELNFTAIVDANSSDIDLSNNEKYYNFIIVGPFDPNDKQVHPAGMGEEGLILNNQTMTYTVRFQNTGTAPAENVRIEDVIDTDLDLSTLNVLSSSHDMFVEVLDNNTLNFHFNNIMLPDSNSNEPESHGYVIFSLNQQENLLPGTQIENTAAIYFDFNSPIITNTVLNTILDPDGIAENITENENLKVYPNPTNDVLTVVTSSDITGTIEIINIGGKVLHASSLSGMREMIDVGTLPAGIYVLRVISEISAATSVRFVKE